MYETPKSPINIPVIQWKYLSNVEISKPSSFLKASTVSGSAFMPSMKDAGSPGMISIIKKIIKDAKNRLNIKIFNLEKKYEDILVIFSFW